MSYSRLCMGGGVASSRVVCLSVKVSLRRCVQAATATCDRRVVTRLKVLT